MSYERPSVLFVCGRNQWRSPTAARIYAADQRIAVRSAGVSPSSHHRVSAADLQWADLVLVMEREHRSRLAAQFSSLSLPPIDCLDIPDEYGFMDQELCQLIREGTEHCLQRRFGIEPTGD